MYGKCPLVLSFFVDLETLIYIGSPRQMNMRTFEPPVGGGAFNLYVTVSFHYRILLNVLGGINLRLHEICFSPIFCRVFQRPLFPRCVSPMGYMSYIWMNTVLLRSMCFLKSPPLQLVHGFRCCVNVPCFLPFWLNKKFIRKYFDCEKYGQRALMG